MTCTASGTPSTVRSEGLSELIAGILLNCTGGEVTPPGQPVPGVNLTITLNTNIGNIVIPAGSYTDAVIAIDNPAPGNQVLQDPTQQPTVVGVGESGLDYGNPFSMANRGQQVPNVFQGRSAGRNSVTWLGIPIDPPGSVGTRIMRIKNVRAQAPADAGAAFIQATLNSPDLNLNVTLDVAAIQPGLLYAQPDRTLYSGIIGAKAFPVGTSVNPGLPNTPANPTADFQARFVEGFPNVFKTRTAAQGSETNPFPAPQEQAMLGQDYFAETGFYNPRFGFGLTDWGTRFAIVVSGVPQNVRVFMRNTTGTGTSPTFSAIGLRDCEGPAEPAPATNGLIEIPLVDGIGKICAEVVRQSPTAIETAVFDGYLSFGGTGSAPPAPGIIFANLVLFPTALYPPGVSTMLRSRPLFQILADPVQSWHTINVVSRIYTDGDPATNVIQVARPPAFQSGIFQGTGAHIVGTNVFLLNSLASKPTTLAPVLRAGPSAQREVTAGWLTILQSQGATPLTLNIQADPAGLAPGTYSGGIRVLTPPPNPTDNELPIQFIVPPPGPRFTAGGVVGAADYAAGVVTAGQAIVVYGSGFGPAQLARLALDNDGRVAKILAETRVLFDDQPAPMIYAATGQVSAFVPFAVADRAVTEMRVEHRGIRSPPVFLRVLAAIPGLFTADASGFGQGAILNQDNSYNTAANPANPGDIVQLFGSGAGQTDPPGVDGRLAGAPLPMLTQPVRVLIDGQAAEVIYAGPAPGLAEGFLQVNARLPANTRRGRNAEVTVIVGSFRSQPGVTVAVAR